MTIQNYIDSINQRYKLGNATEHTFRGDLQQLIENLVPEVRATNEPKRQSCGAPDYILTKKDVPVGCIEAKDIGDKDLEGKKKSVNKEQFDRYKASLDNRLVYDLIVDRLKKAKENRQLIVVTHNANIPVNGDAEYIISMDTESKKLRILNEGTVEQTEIKREICDVMEGSEQAFNMRSKRYKQIG